MKQESYELFKKGTLQEIVAVMDAELQKRNESPFWTDKVVPFTNAILSVLLPLRDQDLLFTPEGEYVEELTPELFIRWSDFVSIKTLAFTLQNSNATGVLQRTKLQEAQTKKYTKIDLGSLGDYLSHYTVNLENESLDFPIANYNLHQGVSNVMKSLL